jgi:MtN3 and saliva related transmembrane protein
MHTDVIGYIAACLTTFSFLIQAVKSFKTKDLSGISLGMYSMFASGVALWLVYGLIIENWPLILTNALTLAFALSILIMKIHQTNSKKDIESN